MNKFAKGAIAIVVIAAAGVVGTNWYLGKKMETAIAKQQQKLAKEGLSFSYDDASVNVLSHSWTVKGIHFADKEQGELFTIKAFTSDNYDLNSLPAHSVTEVTGLQFSPAALANAPADLKDKLSKVSVHARIESNYNSDKGTVSSNTLVDDKTLGELELNFNVSGAKPLMEWAQAYSKKVDTDPQQLQLAQQQLALEVVPKLQDLVINNISLRLKDSGLIDMYYQLNAMKTGRDKATMVKFLQPQITMNPILTDKQRQSLQAFIQGGNELTLKLAPTEKMTVGQIMKASFQHRFHSNLELLHFLGVTLNGNGFAS
ncbi:hypothetical protein [Gallaecimonas mangrovi]|uniref:hypothetical protein n=1 Tax=Gallaecimonas mangrovi TaxID=2291597 RepID=UPI000E1FF063|nr:hypothetical protein [Gallaecimonas mangrovi]